MKCSIADMRNKEVINLQDGTRLGFVGDVEIDTENNHYYIWQVQIIWSAWQN